MENDSFQCHTYLIVDGDESILIDSGSMLEFEDVKRKIESLIDISNIKYLVAHHQDPDVCANMPAFEKAIARDDLQVVSHSRNFALIKHYGLTSKFYVIEEHNYQLKTQHYDLLFVTTPYSHAPGAFVTYLQEQKVLFSSDIFGGVEESWHFYAKSDYFDEIKLFHENYMPSRDILNYSLNKIDKLDLELIAPQHGSIIQKEYIHPLIDSLKKLECGLYIQDAYRVSLLEEEEKEKKLNNKLNTIMDLQDNIIVLSKNGHRITYINEAFFRFAPYENLQEFKKHHNCICDLFIELDGEKYLKSKYDNKTWVEHIVENKEKQFFASIKGRDGEQHLFEVVAKKLDDEHLMIFYDVTVHEKNMDLVDIISHMQGIYFAVTNMQGTIINLSNSLQKELNLDDGVIGTKNIDTLINKKDREKFLKAIQINDSSTSELVLEGNHVKIPVLMQGYFGMINQIPIRITSFIDLREIKKLQKETHTKDLLLMQQSKLAQMGEMVSMIAHQWRQPLNAISAATIKNRMKYEMGLLEGEEFNSSEQFIQDQCQKMSKVIDTFMNFSKNGGKEENFKFEEVVEVVTNLIDGQLSSHGIDLDIDISHPLEIFGDASMLEQIIVNILMNARDAYDENKDLINKTIIIKVVGKCVEIIDFAGGIDESKQEKIFMPYFTTKEQGKGTGLGLYMSKKIMKEHFKGDIYYVGVDKQSKFILDFEPTRGGGVK